MLSLPHGLNWSVYRRRTVNKDYSSALGLQMPRSYNEHWQLELSHDSDEPLADPDSYAGRSQLVEPAETSLVEAARAGDSDAFAHLFRRYRPRLFWLARRYFAPGSDRDDLIQEATIGFYKAVRDFKGDRGAFAAFVDLCVRRQIITFIKATTQQKHAALNWATSIDAPVFRNSDESLATRLTGPEKPGFAELSETTAFLE